MAHVQNCIAMIKSIEIRLSYIIKFCYFWNSIELFDFFFLWMKVFPSNLVEMAQSQLKIAIKSCHLKGYKTKICFHFWLFSINICSFEHKNHRQLCSFQFIRDENTHFSLDFTFDIWKATLNYGVGICKHICASPHIPFTKYLFLLF